MRSSATYSHAFQSQGDRVTDYEFPVLPQGTRHSSSGKLLTQKSVWLLLLGLPLILLGYFSPLAYSFLGVFIIFVLVLLLYDFSISREWMPIVLARNMKEIVPVSALTFGNLTIRNTSALSVRFIFSEDVTPELNHGYFHPRRRSWVTDLENTIYIPPSRELKIRTRLLPEKRGEARLGPVRLLLGSKLGYLYFRRTVPLLNIVKVYPDFSYARGFKLFTQRRKLHGMALKAALSYGKGLEFEKLRDYQSDDDFRAINWKATARKAKPIVNDYQMERDREVLIILDAGRIMRGGNPQRFDTALNILTAFAYVALSARDAVGVLIFSDRPLLFLPPRKSYLQLNTILNGVYGVQPETVESDYLALLSFAASCQRKRALLITVTELTDQIASRDALTSLTLLARKHLVVLATLRDRSLDAALDEEAATQREVFEKAAAAEMLNSRSEVQARLASQGVITLDLKGDRASADLINKYLEIRWKGRL